MGKAKKAMNENDNRRLNKYGGFIKAPSDV